MHVAYIGNFHPPHSTENHVRQALLANGHTVEPYQENTPDPWRLLEPGRYDLVLWTRTGWDWPHTEVALAAEDVWELQASLLLRARAAGTPTVGYHLDRWWGLDREGQVTDGNEPFFGVDLLCTADGGHDAQWEAAGVRHVWFPPAVSRAEAERQGEPTNSLRSNVCFVGSWRPGYHAEWTHRPELIAHLRKRWGRAGLRLWPADGNAIRGQALADLYASSTVVVGDSCLVGDRYTDGAPLTRYWSDRIPETLGRGGFLLHPEVEGLAEHYEPGTHLLTWPLGDWDALDEAIGWALDNPEARAAIAAQGRAHVLAEHTYERRMEQLVQELESRGLVEVQP